VDDYDVVQAIQEFERCRGGNRPERDRDDLLEAIRLCSCQAEKLLAPSRSDQCSLEVQSHYARIRHELLTEVQTLEACFESLVGA
jgi:hypothetical protein